MISTPKKVPQGKSLLPKEEVLTHATELLKPDSSLWRNPAKAQTQKKPDNYLCEYNTDTIPKANGLSMTFSVPCDWEDYREHLGEEDLVKQLAKVRSRNSFDILSVYVTTMDKLFTEKEKSAIIKAQISKSEAGSKNEVVSYKLIKVDNIPGEQIITQKKDLATSLTLNSVIAKFYYKKYIIRLMYTAISQNSVTNSRLIPDEAIFSSLYQNTKFK